MSVKAVGWAFEQRLTPSLKVLLLALADFAGENHECWPSLGTLAQMASMTTRSIRTNLRDLEARGLVRTEVRLRPNGSQTSNVYTLAVNGAEDSSPPRGKLLPPQEPSFEPDLTKTSQRQSSPIVESDWTDSKLSPVEKMMAGQAGITDVGTIITLVRLRASRELTGGEALRVAMWILTKPRAHIVTPQRYVMAVIRSTPHEIQQYIDEQGLGV